MSCFRNTPFGRLEWNGLLFELFEWVRESGDVRGKGLCFPKASKLGFNFLSTSSAGRDGGGHLGRGGLKNSLLSSSVYVPFLNRRIHSKWLEEGETKEGLKNSLLSSSGLDGRTQVLDLSNNTVSKIAFQKSKSFNLQQGNSIVSRQNPQVKALENEVFQRAGLWPILITHFLILDSVSSV